MESTGSRPRSSKPLVILTVACLAVSFAVGVYFLRSGAGVTEISPGDFDLQQVSRRQPVAVAPSVPLQPRSSPPPITGWLGPGRPAAQSPGAAAASKSAAGYDAAAEKEFLARHGAELERYHERMGRVADRYYAQSPIVRDVDRAFGRMERYMAVKSRYERDGDPFQFARGAMALPEVRAEIAKRMADPAVWKASLGMIMDTLKEAPPPAIYAQARSFLLGDPAMAGYVNQFSRDAAKNAPALIQAVPLGADLGPMQKLVGDMTPQPAAAR